LIVDFTKLINNVTSITIKKQLMIVKNLFGVIPNFCREKG